MKKRIFSTLALWTVLIGTVVIAGVPGGLLLTFVFAILSMEELRRLLQVIFGIRMPMVPLLAGGTVFLTGALLIPSDGLVLWILVFLLAIPVLALSASPLEKIPGTAAAWTLFLCAIPLPFALGGIILLEAGLIPLIWLVAVAKFTDAGALLSGLAAGRHHMAPVISPKKTWEGLAGGLVSSVLISVLFFLAFEVHMPDAMTVWHAAWMAIPVAVAGVFADLWESALKRSAHVKDSGVRIPGIGGVLDLTDSLMFAFPTGYIMWIMLG